MKAHKQYWVRVNGLLVYICKQEAAAKRRKVREELNGGVVDIEVREFFDYYAK